MLNFGFSGILSRRGTICNGATGNFPRLGDYPSDESVPQDRDCAVVELVWYTFEDLAVSNDGTRYIPNKGNLQSDNDGVSNAGNGVWLNGIDQSVDVPLDYNLGVDSGSGMISNDDVIVSDNGDGSYNVSCTNFSTGSIRVKHGLSARQKALFNVEVTVVSGVCNVSSIPYALDTEYPFVFDGSFDIECQMGTDNNLYVYPTTGDSFEFNVTFSLKEITSLNTQSLLWYSYDDKEYKALTIDGSLSQELCANGDFSDGDTGWSLGTGWTIADNKATFFDKPTGEYIKQHNKLTPGKWYNIFIDVLDIEDGTTIQYYLHINNRSYLRPIGTHNIYGVAQWDFIAVRGTSDGIGKASVDNISAKERLPLSTKYTIEEPCGQIVPLDYLITQEHLDYINANPEVFADLYTERKIHSALPFDKSNIERYYPSNEGTSNDLWDAITDTTIPIVNATAQCRTELAQVNYGCQDLFYKQDITGRFTGEFTADQEVSFENTENYVDTGFKPDLAEYTIYETLNGEEFRVLKSDGTYKINDAAQANHTLPDPATILRLNNVASIGDADTVDTTDCTFKVFDKITEDIEDTEAYQAWMGCNAVILTDDDDAVLTDDDGKILIV